MKKIILSLLSLFFIALTSQAQIKKGAVLVGGSVGVSTSKTEGPGSTDTKSYNVNFSPMVGIAVKENLVVGGQLFFGTGKNDGGLTEIDNKMYGAGVFLRKYKPLGKGFYLIGQGSLSAIQQKSEVDNTITPATDQTDKQFVVSAGISPAVSYAVNNKLQLEIGLTDLVYVNYSNRKIENNNGTEKTNGFALGSNLFNNTALNIGVRFFFNQ